jgi:glycine dehydrogenase subunit 1
LCAVVGYPNAFGIIEPLRGITELVHSAGGLAISATGEALALGLLKSPGELGVDVAVGEGQSFGLKAQFGGPGLGFMAGRLAHVRQMPGRLVGQTSDVNGHRAYCLTLATREQHIRRERATSNICTNHALCALAATAYLALLGRRGLRQLAARNVELAHMAAECFERAGVRRRFSAPFFNEFVASVADPASLMLRAEKGGVIPGLPLVGDYPEIANGLLVSITEVHSPQDIQLLSEVVAAGNR